MRKQKVNIKELFSFYQDIEKLKTTIRHSYTSDHRRMESVAEHSWMLCLMAMTLFEQTKTEINQLKTLKILLVHDLAEAITGDIPGFEVSKRKQEKKKHELAAMKKITANLSPQTKKEFVALWTEYEEKSTPEGKFAYILDKLEAGLQHCIAGVETWDQNDFNFHGAFYKHDYSQVSSCLAILRDEISELTMQKVLTANQFHRLNEEMKQNYQKMKAK